MTPIDTAELERLAAAIPEGPWIAAFDHPLNAAAFVVQEGEDRYRSIATLYGVHDAVDLPAVGNPWGPHPIRDATAEAISYLPTLIREVLAHRKAEAGMRALLRAGCDLLAIEAEGLREGISVNGVMRPCPEDHATVEAIREMEDWIASVKATLYPATTEAEGGCDERA